MSKQRNFRPRNKLSFDDDAQEDDAPSIKPAAPQAKQTSQPKLAAPAVPKSSSKPSLLSFDDDNGDDIATGLASKKKEKTKSKFGRAVGLPDPPLLTSTTQQSSAGEYTAEKLKELQKNALSLSSAKFTIAPAPPAAPAQEPLIKLSGSFKPAGLPKDDRFTINPTALVRPDGSGSAAAAATADAQRPSAPGSPSGSGDEDAGGAQPMAVQGVNDDDAEDDDDDDAMIIPDEDTIRLAKAKRERLRQAHLAPDYVPLGGASKLLASSKAGAGSRATPELEVQEVGSGSDAEAELEETMRLKFSVQGASRATDRKSYAKTLSVDDDDNAFAEEQLRKAVRRNQAGGTAAAGAGSAAYSAGGHQGQGDGYYDGQYDQSAMNQQQGARTLAGALARSRLDTITQSGAAAVASLREGLARLTASHKAAQANLNKTSNLLDQSLSKVESIEQESKLASEKYVYVQEIRAWVADLLDCLHHKSALVEELEDSLMELREDRATSAREAGQALEDEMLRPAQAAVSAVLGVLGRGGQLAAAQEAGEAAAEEEEQVMEDESAGPPEVDEFGRSLNMSRRREAQQRRTQRSNVIKAEIERVKAAAAGGDVHQEQDEWEVESEAQTSRYANRHQEIMAAAGTVFADAAEEFATLQAVKTKVEQFKARYPKDYANTYMQLSCPALFSPFVRLELLQWDPLYADMAAGARTAAAAASNGAGAMVHKGFDKQAWYESLFDFGLGADPTAMSTDDPDSDLVPQLVRKLVLPLAQHMIDRCWDPLIHQQSIAAANIVGDLLVYVPSEEPGMAELLDSVVRILKQAANRVSLPPWPGPALAAAPMAEAVLSWRFRHAVRYLRCVSVWEGLLSRSLLLELSLQQVVGKHLLHYLRTGAAAVASLPHVAVARVEAVVNALPAEWFTGASQPEAAPLVELTINLATSLETHKEGKERLAAVAVRLARALQRLGQQQRATKLATAFGQML